MDGRLARSVRRLALPVALAALVGCASAPPAPWPLPPQVRTLAVDGYPMAYQQRGQGPVLLFVHGALNDYRYWAPQLAALSDRYRVVSVSLRHAFPERWDGQGGDFTLERHARDIAAFIRALDAGPVHLVGWSRGGAVAVRTAIAQPALLRSLVLVDPGILEFVPAKPQAGPAAPTWAQQAEPLFRRGDLEGGMRLFVDGINGAGAWERMPPAQRQLRLDNAWTLVGQAADAGARPVSCAEVGALAMPLLLLTGERSPPQYRPILDTVLRCQPAARRATIPNASHTMSQQNAPAFDAALERFLQSQ